MAGPRLDPADFGAELQQLAPPKKPQGPRLDVGAFSNDLSDLQPRYDPRSGDPLNEAARNEDEAASDRAQAATLRAFPGPPIRTSRTFGLGEALGAGKAVLGVPATIEKGLEAAGEGVGPGGMFIGSTGPGGFARTVPTARPTPGPSPAGDFVRSLDPTPMLRGMGAGDPEAIGAGLATAAMTASPFARGRPGVRLQPQALGAEAAATAPNPDPFRALGLDPQSATPEDVAQAWRARMKDVHPDVNPTPQAATLAQRYNAARQSAVEAIRVRDAQATQGPLGSPPPQAPPEEGAPPAPAQPAAPTMISDREAGISPETAAKARGRGEGVANVAGSGGRGIEVTGTRPTPSVPPDQMTLADMSGANALSDVADQIRRTNAPVAQAAIERERGAAAPPPVQQGEPVPPERAGLQPSEAPVPNRAEAPPPQETKAPLNPQIEPQNIEVQAPVTQRSPEAVGPPPRPEAPQTERWPFEATTREKVGETARTTAADQVDWKGEFDGVPVELRTRPRPNQALEDHLAESNQRLGAYGAEHSHYLDVQVTKGTLDAGMKARLAKMAEEEDTEGRRALVRDKGAPIHSGVSSTGTIIGREAPRRGPVVQRQDYSVEGSNPKYAKMSNVDLEDRLKELMDRIDAGQKATAEGIRPWARFEPGMTHAVTGTVVTPEAGRAIGAHKTASRLVDEVAKELEVRGDKRDLVSILESAEERQGITKEGEAPPAAEEPVTVPDDYEQLAAEQRSAFEPELRRRIIERLGGGEELSGLGDRELAQRALDSDKLSIQDQSDAFDVLMGAGETGALGSRPTARGTPATDPEASMRDAYRKIFYPEKRGAESAASARLLRRSIGEMRRTIATQYEALKGYRKLVPSLDTKEGIEWYGRAENGVGQVDAKLQAANDAVRALYQQAVQDVQRLKTGKLADPIENYMSHLWADPAKAREVLGRVASRKPLQGGKSFLKQRSIPTLAEGLRAGLKPVTNNPIDLQLLKMREMQKYVMAQRFLQSARAEGIATYVPLGKGAPAGWRRVDDPTFTVHGRSADNELVVRGHYWMPATAAHVVANYLSPGLRGNALYDAYQGVGNSLNAAQLGVSAFHAGFSTLTTAVSRAAVGIGQMRTGRVGQGLGNLLSSPIALPSTIARGLALKAEYLTPGSGGILEQQLARMMERSGGQHIMDPAYKYDALQALKDASAKGNVPKMLAHTLGLGLQKLAWPIMEFYVPVIKMGAFSELMESELARLGPAAKYADVDAAAQAAWHSIDNRFGQVSYDTRFWNNAVKHILMGTVRAVGWDAGTVDELVGGLKDALGGNPSPRSDFLIALPLVVGALGVALQLALTGEGPRDVQDVFEPRDGTFDPAGNANRVALPSYMKDVIGFARHPLTTVSHKLHPLLSFLSDMLQNKDYYGDEVRNPNDPLSKQLQQVAQYVGGQFTPISVRNVQEQARRGQSGGRGVLPFVGVTPASREAVRTPAQNLLYELLGERRPTGATPEEAAQRKARSDAVRALREGEPIDSATRATLTKRQAQGIFQRARENPLAGAFQQLTLAEAEQVYAKADEAERKLWGPLLLAKRRNTRR